MSAPGSALASHPGVQGNHRAPAAPGAEPTDVVPSQSPRLIVPKLGLDEAIVPVPIVSGTWDLTQLDTQVGWLTTTGRWPGDDWAMALVGHVTLSAPRRGPFADLWKARLNDEIIYRARGIDYVYTVTEKLNARPEEVDRLYVPDGGGLVLVTCTDWDYLHFTYAQRLIVQAMLVRQEVAP